MRQVLKKAVSGVSALALSAALAAGAMPVYASGTTVSVASAGAKPGESVTVDVRIDGNTGISNFDFKVSFDEGLTLKSVSKNGYICADGMFVANTAAGYVIWADSKECETTGGTLFSLTFDIAADAKGGEHVVSVGVKDGGTVSGGGQRLDVEFSSGTVTVSEAEQKPSGGSGGTSQGSNRENGSSRTESGGSAEVSGSVPEKNYPAFTDVRREAWYYQPVGELALAKVVSGYPDGSFRPSGTVTCAEALKLILLASGYSAPEAKANAHWASGYYELAAGSGLVGQNIQLDGAISRLEIARIIAGAIGLEKNPQKSPFSDCDDESVSALYYAGLVKGYDGNSFQPQNTITRAEMSTIIWRLYSYAATGQVNG